MILVVATIALGLIAFAFSSAYSSTVNVSYYNQIEAEKISSSFNPTTVNINNSCALIIPYSYFYHGIFYVTVFEVPEYLINSSSIVNPSFGKYVNIYSSVELHDYNLTNILSLGGGEIALHVEAYLDNYSAFYFKLPNPGYIDIVWFILPSDNSYYVIYEEIVS